MTKIVCLLTFRDEEPFLPNFLASVLPAVDQIIAVDDRSDDGGSELLQASGVLVTAAPEATTFGERRQLLLEMGRAEGGTHFICLDADECLTADMSSHGRDLIGALRSGESLAVPFFTLWNGVTRYRVGREYELPLACVFADDPAVDYDVVALHEPRVPAPYLLRRRRLPASGGGIVHFQFTAWRRAQVKQAWYRCRELLDGRAASTVNARYLVTLDTPFVRTAAVENGWMTHLRSPEKLRDLDPSWQLEEIVAWFERYGVAHFERLQIWHVPELKEWFVRAMGREPRPQSLVGTVPRRTLTTAGDLVRAGRHKLARRFEVEPVSP